VAFAVVLGLFKRFWRGKGSGRRYVLVVAVLLCAGGVFGRSAYAQDLTLSQNVEVTGTVVSVGSGLVNISIPVSTQVVDYGQPNAIAPSYMYYSTNHGSLTAAGTDRASSNPAVFSNPAIISVPEPVAGQAYDFDLYVQLWTNDNGGFYNNSYHCSLSGSSWDASLYRGGPSSSPWVGPDTSAYYTAPSGFSLPDLPADLSLGIPTLGSLVIPTGWVTSVMAYAHEIAMIRSGLNPTALAKTWANMLDQLKLRGDQITSAFHDLYVSLFTPSTQARQTLQASWSQFTNWGPYTYVTQYQTDFAPSNLPGSAPAAPATKTITSANLNMQVPCVTQPGQVVSIQTGVDSTTDSLSGLASDSTSTGITYSDAARAHVKPRDGSSGGGTPVSPLSTGMVGIPILSIAAANGFTEDQNGVITPVAQGQFFDTGRRVNLDFADFANCAAFRLLRSLLGAAVYVTIGWGVILRMWPKQEF
jgi:hypothetical protein